MSSWPEAVWIVKKIQKNFDFSSELNYYTVQLNELNTRVNNLIDRVSTDENNLTQLTATLESKTTTFFSEANGNVPKKALKKA